MHFEHLLDRIFLSWLNSSNLTLDSHIFSI
jgi:hypothetical protein